MHPVPAPVAPVRERDRETESDCKDKKKATVFLRKKARDDHAGIGACGGEPCKPKIAQ